MQLLRGVILFYKKLLIPTLVVSAMIGLFGYPVTGKFSLKWVGISYILFTPLFIYFIYEIRNSREYYFYYNLGLSKIVLWISCAMLSIIIGLVMIML